MKQIEIIIYFAYHTELNVKGGYNLQWAAKVQSNAYDRWE